MRTVESFEVIAVSDEFLEILKDIPEAYNAKSVSMGGRVIEGPKCVMKARSMKEIKDNLPNIIKKLVDPQNQHLKIIHKEGYCVYCMFNAGEDPNTPYLDCPHIDKNGCVLSCKSYKVDIKKYR